MSSSQAAVQSAGTYEPSIASEKMYWKDKIDNIMKVINPIGSDFPNDPLPTFVRDMDKDELFNAEKNAMEHRRTERQAGEAKNAIKALEQYIDTMSGDKRSNFYKMKSHFLLAALLKDEKQSDAALQEAEKLYPQVLSSYPQEDHAEIESLEGVIKQLREALGPSEAI